MLTMQPLSNSSAFLDFSCTEQSDVVSDSHDLLEGIIHLAAPHCVFGSPLVSQIYVLLPKQRAKVMNSLRKAYAVDHQVFMGDFEQREVAEGGFEIIKRASRDSIQSGEVHVVKLRMHPLRKSACINCKSTNRQEAPHFVLCSNCFFDSALFDMLLAGEQKGTNDRSNGPNCLDPSWPVKLIRSHVKAGNDQGSNTTGNECGHGNVAAQLAMGICHEEILA